MRDISLDGWEWERRDEYGMSEDFSKKISNAHVFICFFLSTLLTNNGFLS